MKKILLFWILILIPSIYAQDILFEPLFYDEQEITCQQNSTHIICIGGRVIGTEVSK